MAEPETTELINLLAGEGRLTDEISLDSRLGAWFWGRIPVLARTLLDLSQMATINDGLKLGQAVLRSIGKVNRLHKRQVEQAGFAVLKSPDIPSILVELAFISNPSEEANLKDENYQKKLAISILDGVKNYLASLPVSAIKK